MTSIFKKRRNLDDMERVLKNPQKAALFTGYALALGVSLGMLFFLGSKIQTRTMPTGTVEVSTPYSTYLVGEEVQFTIKNDFNSTIIFPNNCPNEPLAVYYLDNNSWQRIHASTELGACSGKATSVEVPSKGNITGSFGDYMQIFSKPGTYRIVAYVEHLNVLGYKDIQVIEKPVPPVAPTPLTTSKSTASPKTTSPSPSTAPAQTTTEHEKEDDD